MGVLKECLMFLSFIPKIPKMKRLKDLIEDPETKEERRAFDLIIQALIFISLVTFSLETMPNLSDSTRQLLRLIEIVTVLIFTIEYIIRLFIADSKTAFVFSFFGIIDILAILPFYITTGIDLRALRMFRVLKLARYSRAFRYYERAFTIVKDELAIFFLLTCILIYFSAVGIYYFEHTMQPDVFASVPHSLWWALVTLTTVGYGDIVPVTVGGRIFTFIMLIIGLSIVAIPSGLVASAMNKAHDLDDDNTRPFDSFQDVD